ncbi:MAG: metallophosphoesterase [Candidatus Saccharibacteria bacterium]|nr:metallophosphoesterase [Moraxellaceae bacterium]
MKLHILSDLHHEISHYIPNQASNKADVIVLGGDIWKGDRGIYWAREQWKNHEIVYVSGNHEFYGAHRKDVLALQRIAAKKTGVHFLENEEVVIAGIRFLGATLWTDFELFGESTKRWCMRDAQLGLNDFRVIFESDRHFSPMDSVVLHQESIAWLERKLKREKFEGKTVVVTHHLPSKKSVAERYVDDSLSACFASNLDHLLGHSALWIHAHTHDSIDYEVKSTRVICNPRGYQLHTGNPENMDFNPSLIVEI